MIAEAEKTALPTAAKSRNVNLDIIRSIAVFFVVSVHFFLNTGFYYVPIQGKRLWLAVCVRTLFMTCVPLFMLLTGYLMNRKRLSKQYFLGISKTLLTYLICCIFILIYTAVFLKENITIYSAVLDILGFTHYSWYVEMYIGLFMMIPFLNLIYNNLQNQKQKLAIVVVFIALTALPSIFNAFDISSIYAIIHPSASGATSKLIPEWWSGFYPITYYFIGAYLKEYKDEINISAKKCFFALLIFTVVFGTYNFWRSHNVNFVWGRWNNWSGIENVIDSVLLFLCILKLNTKSLPNAAKKCFLIVSELSLGAYLLSCIFDDAFYRILNEHISAVQNRLLFYPLIVPAVFLCSSALSWIVKQICGALLKLNGKIKTATVFKNSSRMVKS